MTTELPDHLQSMMADTCMVEQLAASAKQQREEKMSRPSYMLRPRLFIDGNQWCALHGKDMQFGVCGFGDSPEDAYSAFDNAWVAKLNQQQKAK